ncbi:putative RNA polymerase sigma factor [Bradyrhizobium sp. i1.8.4]|uniref:hypothetical protein n=1 Tax=unclassified Bradyrhizobium TaxID=2631580 RepID=UPI003D223709
MLAFAAVLRLRRASGSAGLPVDFKILADGDCDEEDRGIVNTAEAVLGKSILQRDWPEPLMVRSAERASLYDASNRQANHEAGLVASSFETLAAEAPRLRSLLSVINRACG